MSAGRDGSGNYNRAYDWTDDAANSIAITASRVDTETDGIAAALTNSVAADGQTTMTGALKMGGFKVTNAGDAALVTDVPNAGQISDNDFGYLGTTAGTSSAYTLSPSPAVAAYVTGQEFSFTTNADNTTTTTLNISALGATNIKVLNSSGAKELIAAGDLKNGISYKVRYDGTDMLLTDMSLLAASVAATTTVSGIVELATDAEVRTGTDAARVSPISSLQYHQGVAQAWVNWINQGTLTVNDSYNVTSVTDNAVGRSTVNFSITMSNANYCVPCGGGFTSGVDSSSYNSVDDSVAPTTTAVRIAGSQHDGVAIDLPLNHIAIFGDR